MISVGDASHSGRHAAAVRAQSQLCGLVRSDDGLGAPGDGSRRVDTDRTDARRRNGSILRDGRAVFDIAGNEYRIVVWIDDAHHTVYIRFVGTHAPYDRIDAQQV
jgi:hypothetical protein